MIQESTYLFFQKQIQEKKSLRIVLKFFGIYNVLLFFAVGIYLLGSRKGILVDVLAIVSFIIARFIFCEVIYVFYKKQHPYQKYNFKIISSRIFSLTDKRADAFPSEHTISYAAISMVFFMFYPVLGVTFFALTVLVAIARIMLGYHDISEVVAGFVLGVLTSFAVAYWLPPYLFTQFV